MVIPKNICLGLRRTRSSPHLVYPLGFTDEETSTLAAPVTKKHFTWDDFSASIYRIPIGGLEPPVTEACSQIALRPKNVRPSGYTIPVAKNADFVFLSDLPLLFTNPLCSRQNSSFLLISEPTKRGHNISLYISQAGVYYRNVKNRKMISLLKKWFSSDQIAVFSMCLRLYNWPPESLKFVLGVIYEHISRIQGIEIDASDLIVEQFFAAIDPTDAINLTHLKFEPRSCTQDTILKLFRDDDGFPNFLHLIYPARVDKSLTIEPSQDLISSSFNSLEFSITITEHDCIALLSQCSRATGIKFHRVMRDDVSGKALTPLTKKLIFKLPNFQTLHVVIADFDVTTMLDYFICPTLTTLSLTIAPMTLKSISRLMSFLNRRVSDEPLALLNIFDYSMETHIAIPLLRAIYMVGWGPERKGIVTFGIFSSSLPKDLVQGFSAAWDASKKKDWKLLKRLYKKHKNSDKLHVRPLSRIGWGHKPVMFAHGWD